MSLAAQRAVRHGLQDDMGGVLAMAAFLGVAEPGDGEESETDKALEIAKRFKKQDGNETDIAYCEPGEVHPLPGLGVDVYVLGPPTDYADLRMTDPASLTGITGRPGATRTAFPSPIRHVKGMLPRKKW